MANTGYLQIRSFGLSSLRRFFRCVICYQRNDNLMESREVFRMGEEEFLLLAPIARFVQFRCCLPHSPHQGLIKIQGQPAVESWSILLAPGLNPDHNCVHPRRMGGCLSRYRVRSSNTVGGKTKRTAATAMINEEMSTFSKESSGAA